MDLNKSLFLVFTAFVLCESGFDEYYDINGLPDVEQLPKCKLNDDNCKKGLIQTVLKILAKTGLPEKGIPKLDPLSVSNESFKIADVIDLTLVDGVVKGIKDCTVNRFTASIEDERATIELTCDVTIKGRYKVFSDSPLVKTFSGGDTVKGEGNGKVKIEKMFLSFDFDYFFQDRDGEIYVKCKNDKLKYQYDIKGKMLFFADNLFVGGKESTSYISSCSRNDPNLNDCALKSARDSLHQFSQGDSERGLRPLDPLYVAEMTVYIPNKQGFKVTFKDNYFTGLSKLHLENLKFDLEKKMIIADALVTLDVKNTYDLSGRVLLIPVKSNGDSAIHLKNTLLHIRFWYEHVEGADGKIYWKIYKHDIKYEVERASFRLENLLNDPTLGDQINRILNEMWREIVADVGPSICQSLSTAVVENLSVLLEQVPYDELLPE
ncbi:unnamed protein product [Spodoptera exigua]|nr:unnamed protein product [Spodoptera exigua]